MLDRYDVIRDFDFHPHEFHVRVFPCAKASVLRWDDVAFVGEALYDNVGLRHYAFPDEWFKINVTTDRGGRIVETPPFANAPAFAFNCDIATPMVQNRNAIYAVDLFADVLVREDGTTFEIVDLATFSTAVAVGLISPNEHHHASDGLVRLIELIRENELISFLATIYPFGNSSAQPALPSSLVPVSDVLQLQPRLRTTW